MTFLEHPKNRREGIFVAYLLENWVIALKLVSRSHQNYLEKLVSRVLREGKIHYSPKEHDLLQQLFQTMFVLPSATKGLLGDTCCFRVISDGSPALTGARSFGKFLCDCRKSGNWKCSCKRQFSDPDADWGWDSYREKYFYGRTLYMFTAAESPYNLPVYPRLFRASIAFLKMPGFWVLRHVHF
ncbi:hypothetical protein FHR92_000150 [Fontibacillus solani]|uniref:Uncharacterized protein n=1 Tax=Fontibacillus solani TaxID=1572857 RepID=A0A7W3SPI3_9BACL|nr:hypothetical protein [Fontibacillus solani]MBA9083707.1 hypothetical protein [Fontibacillus solani]